MKNSTKILIVLLSILIFISGCSSEPSENSDEEKQTLKIAFIKINSFNERYEQLLKEKFPNIDFLIIDDDLIQTNDIKKWVDEHQPDIIYMSDYQKYLELIDAGYLVDLEPLIKQDEYDIASFVPGVVELLKTVSHNKIHALATNFMNNALIFNKQMFDTYNLPYPTDYMSWKEVFELASLFHQEIPVHPSVIGYMNKTPYFAYFFLSVGESNGLSIFDLESGKVTINTEKWEEIWNMIITGYQNGYIKDRESHQEFLPSNVAMYLGNYIDYRLLINGDTEKEWAIVTAPIDPLLPDKTKYLKLVNIYGINSISSNRDLAWEIIKYITGDKIAKVEANSPREYGFSVRTKWNETIKDLDVDAYYKLSPALLDQPIPIDYKEIIINAINEEFENVMGGSQDVDFPLEAIELKAQEAIDAYIQNSTNSDDQG